MITFSSDTTPGLADLDANFADLYDLREHISTPAYPASNPLLTLDSNQLWKFLMTYGGGSFLPLVTLANGATGAGNQSPALGLSCNNNVIAGIWARRYANSGGDLLFGVQPPTGGDPVQKVRIFAGGGDLAPETDNTQRLGLSAVRWSTVYAGTGSINTSDAREKTVVVALTAQELAAAKALSAEIGTYKWLSAVQAKGADARTHIGLTVQRAIEIMTAHGLDPLAYGFICHDAWEALVDEDGVVERPAGDRYAFRPDELLLFIARGVDARLAALEAALEAA